MSGDHNFGKAKQALLASGLPLEMSVERLLRSMRFSVTADYTYWRRSDGGHKDFSVDVRALRSLPTPWITTSPTGSMPGVNLHATWNVLVECKYRNPSVKWVFAPRTDPLGPGIPEGMPQRSTHFFMHGLSDIPLSSLEAGHLDVLMRDDRGVPDLTGVPVLVTRAVEFRPRGGQDESDEAFSATIRRGVYQLQFAHVPRLTDALRYGGARRGRKIEEIPHSFPDVHLEVATLVLATTAELWVFRRDVDLRSIEAATALADVADAVDAVEYSTTLSRELRSHQEEWLRAIEKNRTFGPPDREAAQREQWKALVEAVGVACPSVLIVRHDALEPTLEAQSEALRRRLHRMAEEFARSRGFTVRT